MTTNVGLSVTTPAGPFRVPDDAPLAVTILGSGGPQINPTRTSSSYVVWIDRKPRLLVDAGGGTYERIGRAGIDPAGLDPMLISHMHIDHTGGLAPVIFAAFMHGRTSPLTVIGPQGRDDQAGCTRFCDLLFGTSGAWNYLHTFDGFGITPVESPSGTASGVNTVWDHEGITIRATGVPHGMMPSVAYRVDYAGCSLVFSGDIEGVSPSLDELAQGCDVLIHDQALPRRDMADGNLHSPPEETAANAVAAGAHTLVLSHFMVRIEDVLDDVVRRVAAIYGGQIIVAHDLLGVTSDGRVFGLGPR